MHWKFNFKDILQTTGIISSFSILNNCRNCTIGRLNKKKKKTWNNNEGGEKKTVNKYSVRITNEKGFNDDNSHLLCWIRNPFLFVCKDFVP